MAGEEILIEISCLNGDVICHERFMIASDCVDLMRRAADILDVSWFRISLYSEDRELDPSTSVASLRHESALTRELKVVIHYDFDPLQSRALCFAVYQNNVDLSYHALRRRANPNTEHITRLFKDRPLQYAVRNSYAGLVTLLCEATADVGFMSLRGTALHEASFHGLLASAKALCAARADVNQKNQEGEAPLHAGVSGGHSEIIDLLCHKRADINCETNKKETPLHKIRRWLRRNTSQSLELIAHLCKSLANVNAEAEDGNTLLIDATNLENEDAVHLLLRSRANLNECRMPPLVVAAKKGHERIASTLISQKANIEIEKNNLTPYLISVFKGHFAIVRLLTSARASATKQIKERELPLWFLAQAERYLEAPGEVGCPLIEAAAHGKLALIRKFCSERADVNVMGKRGITPLLEAVRHGHVETCDFLCQQKASCDVRSVETPLFTASWFGFSSIALCLVNARAILDDSDGKRSLRIASTAGHCEVVRILLLAGAEPLETDIGAALSCGHKEVSSTLQSYQLTSVSSCAIM